MGKSYLGRGTYHQKSQDARSGEFLFLFLVVVAVAVVVGIVILDEAHSIKNHKTQGDVSWFCCCCC